MKVRNTKGLPPKDKGGGSKSTGIKEGVPLPPPEDTKYSMKYRDAKHKDMRLKENKKKKSLESAPLGEARPHTVWVRRDIWAAVEIYRLGPPKRSIRSVMEQALYNFLIKEQRVVNVEDLGEDAKDASWSMEYK
jgi:hypothetical protein